MSEVTRPEFDEMRENLKTCNKNVELILGYMYNDEGTGRKGMYQELQDIRAKTEIEIKKLDYRLSKVEEREKVRAGKSAILYTIFTAVGALIWAIVDKLFLRN